MLQLICIASFVSAMSMLMPFTTQDSRPTAPADPSTVAAMIEQLTETRNYRTTITQRIWRGVDIDEATLWQPETWYTKKIYDAAYGTRSVEIQTQSFRSPATVIPVEEHECYHNDRSVHVIMGPSGAPESIGISGRFVHPGFNEFPIWFNQIPDRYPAALAPIVPALLNGNIIHLQQVDGTIRCRFFRSDRELMQTEIILELDPLRVREVHHFYSRTDERDVAFEDRITDHLHFFITRWKEYDDGFVLPAEAKLITRNRTIGDAEWRENSFLYERLSATLDDDAATGDCEPAITAGVQVHDQRINAVYTIGRDRLLLDGSRYQLEDAIDRIIEVDELDQILAGAQSLDAGSSMAEALFGAQDSARGQGVLRIVLIGIAAGLGAAWILIFVFRRGQCWRACS